jgi:delta 1-pyrroline-5-carboxylate dehydrogenase
MIHTHYIKKWRQTTSKFRLQLIRKIVLELEIPVSTNQIIEYYLVQFEKNYLIPTELVGPTGESNTLSFLGRGGALIYFDESPEQTWLVNTLVAILTGNSVYINLPVKEHPKIKNLQTILKQHAAECAFHIVPQKVWYSLIPDPNIAVIAMHAELSDLKQVADVVANDHPMIPQLIFEEKGEGIRLCYHDSFFSYWLLENTTTINTTAIGGNTSLLQLN